MINQNNLTIKPGSVTQQSSSLKIMPKIVSLKVIKPSAINAVPLLDKVMLSNTQVQQSPSMKTTNPMQHSITELDSSTVMENDFLLDGLPENNCVDNANHFIWNHKSTMLFFSEYEEHAKKFQKRKYQSKEAMFEAIAKSFQNKGYTNTTKNHIKNKFKLLKKNWDNHVKRTSGKNSSGKGTKPLIYEQELVNIFGNSHSGAPLFVAGRYGTTSQKDILENVIQNLSENEYEEEEEQMATNSNIPIPSTNNSTSRMSSMMDSRSSTTNAKAKPRDGRLAQTLQSVKDSICAILQKESDNKHETRAKILVELQRSNELQKERNIILEKQLLLLENLAKQINPTENQLKD